MSLDKAIKYGKEHRKEYRGGKSVSRHCENNGGRRHQWECPYCKDNRTHKNRKREEQYSIENAYLERYEEVENE